MRPTMDQAIAISPTPNSIFNPKEKSSIDASNHCSIIVDRTICDT